MALINWPASLPQELDVQGFQERIGDPFVRSQMEAGNGKVRRRFSQVPDPVSGSIVVDEVQWQTLRTFYRANGAARFNWVRPNTLTACEMRFREPPQATAAGGGLRTVTLSLEMF